MERTPCLCYDNHMKNGQAFASVSSATYFQRMDLEDIVADLPAHGVSDAELFLNSFCEYEPDFVRLLADRAEKAGLRIHAVHPMSIQFEPQLFSIHPRQFGDAMRLFEKVLQDAVILGAKRYVMHGPPYIRGVLKNVQFDRISGLLGDLSDTAAGYGVTLCFENVSWCLFQEPDFGKALADRLGDRLHYTLDIKQAFRSGHTPDDYIDAVGPLIRNVHLCDYLKDGSGQFVWKLPGKGCYSFEALFERLRSIGYSGPLTLEGYSDSFRDTDEIFDSYRYLKALADRIFSDESNLGGN